MSTYPASATRSSFDVVVVVLAGGAVAGVLELDVSTDVERSVGGFTADTTPAFTCSLDAC